MSLKKFLRNKKGISWSVLLSAILIFAFLLLAIGLYQSLFGETKEKTKETVEGMIPSVSVGVEEVVGEQPVIEEAGGEEAVERLIETIEKMLSSSKEDCVANYGGLPELKERGTSLGFNYDGEKTTMVVKVKGGKQVGEMKELEGMVPCVIGGESGGEDVSENFYYTFLEPEPEKVKGGPYSSVRGVEIKWDDGGYLGGAGTKIFFEGAVSKLEDGGWLFTPDHRLICFFPTVDGDNDEGGLNDDFVKGSGERSISRKVEVDGGKVNKKLKFC